MFPNLKMGIPRFFHYCYTNYPEIVAEITSKKGCDVDIDFIYFDLNAVIHGVCQTIFEYGSGAVNKSFLKKKNKENKTQSCYNKVCETIEKYVNLCKPKKGVFVAIDGVCGMAKCNQQRQRRFKSAKTNNDNIGFDPNCISPGTVFMDLLSKHVSFFLEKKIQDDWSHLELIISNEKVVGEGEHKCIKHIRDNLGLNSLIVSPDADLFMLMLSCHDFDNDRKLFLMRENIYDNVSCDYFIININELAEKIVNRVCEEQKNNIRKTEIITDFVFYCFFLGNDFLPSLPCVEIINQGMDFLFDVYSENLKEKGNLCFKQGKRLILNRESFAAMLRKINDSEISALQWKYKKNNVSNDPYLSKCMLDQDGKKFDMDKYRRMYYKAKFDRTKPTVASIKHYIEGLIFVLRYYFDEIPSYTWYYQYHYAPFAGDIADVMDKYNEDKEVFAKTSPIFPIQQLFCILPPKSKELLPKAIQKYMSEEDNEIGEMMKTDLVLDSDFKKNDWEYILLTPNIDQGKFMEIFNRHAKEFTDYETKRNVRGKVFVYYTEDGECYMKEIIPKY